MQRHEFTNGVENPTNISPTGHHLLIAPNPVAETASPGGTVVKPHNVIAQEEMAQVDGVLIACGNLAWCDLPEPYAQPGQRVIFSKYAGILREFKGKKYRLIEDIEIVATLGDEA